MRIGECADLSYDCLRAIAPNEWAIHVPLGKLKTERMVPIDASVSELIQRLRFFRSLDPLRADGRLLARPSSKNALVRQLRDYLHQVCYSLGFSTLIVPHQFRHTYATELLRAGISFPVLMKLLGHTNPEMTMRYVDVALTDLQREFHQARSNPKYLTPQPTPSSPQLRAGIDGEIESLHTAQQRAGLPQGQSRGKCAENRAEPGFGGMDPEEGIGARRGPRPRPLWGTLAARRFRYHGIRQRGSGIQDRAADGAQNLPHAGEIHPLRTEGATGSGFEPWALGDVHASVLEYSPHPLNVRVRTF